MPHSRCFLAASSPGIHSTARKWQTAQPGANCRYQAGITGPVQATGPAALELGSPAASGFAESDIGSIRRRSNSGYSRGNDGVQVNALGLHTVLFLIRVDLCPFVAGWFGKIFNVTLSASQRGCPDANGTSLTGVSVFADTEPLRLQHETMCIHSDCLRGRRDDVDRRAGDFRPAWSPPERLYPSVVKSTRCAQWCPALFRPMNVRTSFPGPLHTSSEVGPRMRSWSSSTMAPAEPTSAAPIAFATSGWIGEEA